MGNSGAVTADAVGLPVMDFAAQAGKPVGTGNPRKAIPPLAGGRLAPVPTRSVRIT